MKKIKCSILIVLAAVMLVAMPVTTYASTLCYKDGYSITMINGYKCYTYSTYEYGGYRLVGRQYNASYGDQVTKTNYVYWNGTWYYWSKEVIYEPCMH